MLLVWEEEPSAKQVCQWHNTKKSLQTATRLDIGYKKKLLVNNKNYKIKY